MRLLEKTGAFEVDALTPLEMNFDVIGTARERLLGDTLVFLLAFTFGLLVK